ncbi:hypothetical protein cyc_07496 [Cyclospora cayetanensis]|uniref:Uncharacterized protein n=1 Tax=Cyclospora cayetanensis TaxID=88456 RepID=A0A1D3D808_9EIME|nr:hypothetical protein cyc_07496 [Cyclospora cayetanensis]
MRGCGGERSGGALAVAADAEVASAALEGGKRSRSPRREKRPAGVQAQRLLHRVALWQDCPVGVSRAAAMAVAALQQEFAASQHWHCMQRCQLEGDAEPEAQLQKLQQLLPFISPIFAENATVQQKHKALNAAAATLLPDLPPKHRLERQSQVDRMQSLDVDEKEQEALSGPQETLERISVSTSSDANDCSEGGEESIVLPLVEDQRVQQSCTVSAVTAKRIAALARCVKAAKLQLDRHAQRESLMFSAPPLPAAAPKGVNLLALLFFSFATVITGHKASSPLWMEQPSHRCYPPQRLQLAFSLLAMWLCFEQAFWGELAAAVRLCNICSLSLLGAFHAFVYCAIRAAMQKGEDLQQPHGQYQAHQAEENRWNQLLEQLDSHWKRLKHLSQRRKHDASPAENGSASSAAATAAAAGEVANSQRLFATLQQQLQSLAFMLGPQCIPPRVLTFLQEKLNEESGSLSRLPDLLLHGRLEAAVALVETQVAAVTSTVDSKETDTMTRCEVSREIKLQAATLAQLQAAVAVQRPLLLPRLENALLTAGDLVCAGGAGGSECASLEQAWRRPFAADEGHTSRKI